MTYKQPIVNCTLATIRMARKCVTLRNRSRTTDVRQTHRPTLLPTPRTKSMKKNMTEKICGMNSNFAIASGYETNASPVPPFTTAVISSIPVSCAKLPRIPKIIIPDKMDVIVSRLVTIRASLGMTRKKYILILYFSLICYSFAYLLFFKSDLEINNQNSRHKVAVSIYL